MQMLTIILQILSCMGLLQCLGREQQLLLEALALRTPLLNLLTQRIPAL